MMILPSKKARAERLQWLPIAALHALTRNPQYLTPSQLDALKASIARDGFVAPILARPLKSGGFEVVSGNHRVMAAKELEYQSVPAIVVKMDGSRARRVAINLNTVHGDPPAELLAPFLAELDDENLKLVHLEQSLLADVLKFDEELSRRLSELKVPSALDNDSPLTNIVRCVCPTCGASHIKKNAAH